MTLRSLSRLAAYATLALLTTGASLPRQEPRPDGPPAGHRRVERYPNQLAQDWEAGRVPRADEIAEAERAAEAAPEDHPVVRRLAKAYFFQYFGGRRAEALAKARATFERVLALRPDDAESHAYLGALDALEASRELEGEAQRAAFRRALERLERAEQLDPNHGAVLSVAAGSYLWFPDEYGTVPRAAAAVERLRAGMGPMFSKFSHHGQQRILLTQGQAYARMGRLAEARALFEQGLEINRESVEAGLIEVELDRLGAPGSPSGERE